MIDIRYFLARQKTTQRAAPAKPPSQKEAPASSPTQPVISAGAGLRYLGLPDAPPPYEVAFDLTKQNDLEGCES